MICANNTDNTMLFSRVLGSHSRGGGPKRQLRQDRPRSGLILMGLGNGQFITNQGKENKPPVYYNYSKASHFERDYQKKAKRTGQP